MTTERERVPVDSAPTQRRFSTATVIIGALCGVLLAGMAAAQPATIDALFDPNLLQRLDWRPLVETWGPAETRYGEVSVRYTGKGGEFGGTVEILFDGRPAAPAFPWRNEYGIVNVGEVYPIGEVDVVLVRATAGGSGSPPPLLHLLPVGADGAASLVTDPSFRSADGVQRVVFEGSRIYFDLGYQRGQRKHAVFADGRLAVRLSDAQVVPLSAAECGALHQIVGSSICTLRQGLPNSALRLLNSLSHHPGFRREPFTRACDAAGEGGQAPPYDAFEREVCRLR